MRCSILPRIARAILAALMGAVALSPVASAQPVCFVGPFGPVDASRTGQNGFASVVPIGASQIRLESASDADNLLTTADPIFDLPPEAQGAINYAASPSLDFVLCYPCPNVPGCSSVQGYQSASIAVLRRPTTGTMMQLVHTDCLPAGVLNGTGVWYDAGVCGLNTFTGACTVSTDQQPGNIPCNRVLMLRTIGAFAGGDQLRIYDLQDTTPSSLDGQAVFNARQTIQDTTLRINRNGDFLLIQHDIAPVQPQTADWELVDLCPASATFGQAVHRISDDQSPSAQITASVASCTSDQTTISFAVNGVTSGSVTFPRCCAPSPPPPPTGRCCTPGGCSVTTLAGCAAGVGGWSQGLDCTTPCPPPPPSLRISVSAPAGVTSGDDFTYQITLSNIGLGDATGVSVRQSLPAGVTFVSAIGAGVVSNTATWTVGTLAAGASQTFPYAVRATCVSSTSQVTNTVASASASNYPTIFAATVTTTVSPRPITPVTLALSGAPQRLPLRAGDVIDYTFAVTNSAAAANPNLSMTFISPGQQTVWDSVITPAGGVVTISSGGTSLSWTRSFAAGELATLTVRARVAQCISENSDTTRLNNGAAVSLRNPCNQVAGSATPPPAYPLARPVSATLRGTNVASGVIGPAASGGVFGPRLYQPVREGAAMTFEVELRNTLPDAVPDALYEFIVPAVVSVNDPPLVAPIPAGAAWDAATRRISFTGSIPGGSSVFLRFEGAVASGGQCQQLLHSTAGTTTCRNATADLQLLFVPPVPTQPHLQFADGFRGLFLFTPGVDAGKRDLLCMQGETYTDLYRNKASGDLLISGLPAFLFNPQTLDFAILDAAIATANGGVPVLTKAVAVDPVDGTLLISSTNSPHLWRFDRAAGTLTALLNDSVLGSPAEILAEDDGTLLILTNAGALYRFDGRTGPFPRPRTTLTLIPIPPPDYSGLGIGNFQSRSGSHLVFTPEGNASLVLSSFFSTGAVWNFVYALFDIDRATRTPTLIHRSVAAGSYSASTGNPVSPPAGLGLISSDIRNSAVARGSGTFFALPVGPLNTNIVGVDFTTTPPNIPVNAFNASFSAGGAEWVDPTLPPTCPPDFNADGALNPDDLGDFITCYFEMPPCPGADYNHDTAINPDDLGDYITDYFMGC